MDINDIKLSLLDLEYQDFLECSSSFSNEKYVLFQDSYIKKCEDFRFQRMAQKLEEKYNKIQKGYANILSYWDSYLQDCKGVEKILAQNNSWNIKEGDLLSFASRNFEELGKFQENISEVLSPSLIQDVDVSSAGLDMAFSMFGNINESLGGKFSSFLFDVKNSNFGSSSNPQDLNHTNSDFSFSNFNNNLLNSLMSKFTNSVSSSFFNSVQKVKVLPKSQNDSENISLSGLNDSQETNSFLSKGMTSFLIGGLMGGMGTTANSSNKSYSFSQTASSVFKANSQSQTSSNNNNSSEILQNTILSSFLSSFSGKTPDSSWEKIFFENAKQAEFMSKCCDITIKSLQKELDFYQKELDNFLLENVAELESIDGVRGMTPENLAYYYQMSADPFKGVDPELLLTNKNGQNVFDFNRVDELFEKEVFQPYQSKFSKLFLEKNDSTYEEFKNKIETLQHDIDSLKASKYSYDQQVKASPYKAITFSKEYQNYQSSLTFDMEDFDINNAPPDDVSPIVVAETLEKEGIDRYMYCFHHSNIQSMDRYNLMTSEEKNLYNFLFEKKGRDAAEDYIEAIADSLNFREGLKETVDYINNVSEEKISVDYKSPTLQQDFLNEIQKIQVGDEWYAGLSTFGKGFSDGIENFGEGLANVFATEGIISTNQYAQMFILQALTSKKILSSTYEFSMSAGNMAPSIVVSAAAGPAGLGASASTASTVGYALSGLSIFGNSKNQALVSGNSLVASSIYGTFSGVSELTLGKLLGNIGILNENASFTLQRIFNEGIEEFAQEYVDAGLRTSILHEKIDVKQLFGDSGKAFLYGMIMSGVTTGGTATYEIVFNNSSYNLSISDLIEMEHLIDSSSGSSRDEVISNYLSNISTQGHAENYFKEMSIQETQSKVNLEDKNQTAVSSLTSNISSVKNNISDTASRVVTETKNEFFSELSSLKSDLLETGSKVVQNVRGSLTEAKVELADGMKDFVNTGSKMVSNVTRVVSNTKDTIVSELSDLNDGLVDMGNDVADSILNVVSDTKDTVSSKFNAAENLVKNTGSKISKKIGNIFNKEFSSMESKIEDSSNDSSYHIDLSKVSSSIKEVVQDWFANAFMPKTLGENLEKVFFDENYIIGIHQMGELTINQEGKNIIGESILEEGLRLTGHSSQGISSTLIENFKSVHYDEQSIQESEFSNNIYFLTQKNTYQFAKLLKGLLDSAYYKAYGEGGAAIVRIPKSDLSNPAKLVYEKSGEAVLKPEYILGYVNSVEGKLSDLFTKNDNINNGTNSPIKSEVSDKVSDTNSFVSSQVNSKILDEVEQNHYEPSIVDLQNQFEQLLATDSRLVTLLKISDSGMAVQIPDELADSFVELLKLRHRIKIYGTKATISSTLEDFSEQINSSINDILKSKVSLPKSVLGILTSPISLVAKFKYNPVLENSKLCQNMQNNGLYHITDMQSAQKILESGYVKASSHVKSYGSKKAFFFAGLPLFDDVAVNISGFQEKCVAIKLNVRENDLSDFRYRKFSDQAVTHDGNYYFDSSNASIAYLGLFEENGQLVYKEISESAYNNFHTDVSSNFLNRELAFLNSLFVGIAREGQYFLQNLNLVKNIFTNINLDSTNTVLRENVQCVDDVFENVDYTLENTGAYTYEKSR